MSFSPVGPGLPPGAMPPTMMGAPAAPAAPPQLDSAMLQQLLGGGAPSFGAPGPQMAGPATPSFPQAGPQPGQQFNMLA